MPVLYLLVDIHALLIRIENTNSRTIETEYNTGMLSLLNNVMTHVQTSVPIRLHMVIPKINYDQQYGSACIKLNGAVIILDALIDAFKAQYDTITPLLSFSSTCYLVPADRSFSIDTLTDTDGVSAALNPDHCVYIGHSGIAPYQEGDITLADQARLDAKKPLFHVNPSYAIIDIDATMLRRLDSIATKTTQINHGLIQRCQSIPFKKHYILTARQSTEHMLESVVNTQLKRIDAVEEAMHDFYNEFETIMSFFIASIKKVQQEKPIDAQKRLSTLSLAWQKQKNNWLQYREAVYKKLETIKKKEELTINEIDQISLYTARSFISTENVIATCVPHEFELSKHPVSFVNTLESQLAKRDAAIPLFNALLDQRINPSVPIHVVIFDDSTFECDGFRGVIDYWKSEGIDLMVIEIAKEGTFCAAKCDQLIHALKRCERILTQPIEPARCSAFSVFKRPVRIKDPSPGLIANFSVNASLVTAEIK